MRQLSGASGSFAPGWLVGGGEMGKLVRSMDWSATPLGPIDRWPESLRTTVNLALASNFPISIAWGPWRVQIYNDGYWPICGGKHPASMGQDFKECWFSAWPAIGEAFESASAGTTAFLENQRMFLDRHGYLEETFFTFSFSPIRDDTGRVAGLFHPVTEMTGQTLAERRLDVLREIADASADARTVEQAARLIAETLERHPLDVPFAAIYLVARDGKAARLASSAHIEAGSPAARDCTLPSDDDVWTLGDALRANAPREFHLADTGLAEHIESPYSEPPATAMVMPISVAGRAEPLAILVAGISPRRPFDDNYRTFYLMLQETTAKAIVNARSYEDEKRRAEALAELDRAKTAFFSSVSHEFRTPLTLMLGTLDEALGDSETAEPRARERLTGARAADGRASQRHAAAETRQLTARLLAYRGRPRAGELRAGGPRGADRGSREQLSLGLRAGIDRPRSRLPRVARARLCRPGHVGEDRPQSAVERIQVHVRGRYRGVRCFPATTAPCCAFATPASAFPSPS